MGSEWNRWSGHVLRHSYVLGELVAERKNSATFLTDRPDDRGRAVTEIRAADSPEAERQLHRWSVARGLAHPHLVHIYDAGEEVLDRARFIYAVKEQPEECLADVLVTRALTVEEARQVVEVILLCLAYLQDHGLTHGAVEPASVLAVGGQIKLAADTLSDPTSSRFEAGPDLYSLGLTILELLTHQRPVLYTASTLPESQASVASLPSPFREIAIGCLQPEEAQRWQPRQALAALSETEGHFAPMSLVQSGQTKESWPWILLGRPGVRVWLACASLVCAAVLVRSTQRQAPAWSRATKPVYDPVQDDRPSPIPPHRTTKAADTNTAPASPSTAVPFRRSALRGSAPNWGVIAATYKDFERAQQYANFLQGRWKGFRYPVYPPKGHAEKYYYVLLGSGLTQEAAERLLQQATAAGLPGNSYVTKISPSPVLDEQGSQKP